MFGMSFQMLFKTCLGSEFDATGGTFDERFYSFVFAAASSAEAEPVVT
jgi:hypothetical protein